MRSFTLAVAAALLLTVGAARAEPLQIRLSYIVPVSNWATILFQKPELARHLGHSYTFEAVHFQGTPQLTQALAAGELEIANYGFTTFPLAVLNAGMGDLRIISDELQDGMPGYYTDEYMVRKEDPIKTIEDLKGKIVATNAVGSGVDIPMRAIFVKHHLDLTRDITFVEAPNPAMPAMLFEHKVDLFPSVLPFSADPMMRARTRTLFTQADAFGPTQLGMWVARAPFIAKNRAVLVDFMEDALRAERWYLDPKNHEEAVAIAVKVTKAPPERWESWLFRKDGQKGDYYRDPEGRPNVASLQATTEAQRKLGFVKGDIDVKKYVDLSLVEEASKRLK